MKVHPVHKYPRDSVDTLLTAIPFYKSIKQVDQYQYEILLNNSKIIECLPGEVVLEKGQHEEWLYFLLKGQLEVRAGQESARVVNYITPGEVFGDLAVLFDHVRTATVVADSNSKRTLVFGTHFKVFGKLMDFHPISLQTKLVYYRNMVHNLRWKLEVYRAAYPDLDFADAHRKVKLYAGPRDTREELLSLDAQARDLAKLLVNWNDSLSPTPRSGIDIASLQALI